MVVRLNDDPESTSGSTTREQATSKVVSDESAVGAGDAQGPDVTNTQPQDSGAHRPKFRERASMPDQPVRTSAGIPSSRRMRGLIAAVVAVIIVVIVVVQSLHGSTPPVSAPVANNGSPGTSTNPAGALTASAGAPLATQPLIGSGGGGHIMEPHEAVLGPGGDIYVSDPVAHGVLVYSAQGRYLRILRQRGAAQAITPFSLTMCSNGHLYVLDDSSDATTSRILDYQGAGNTLVQSIGTVTYLSRGRGLACDSTNKLYVPNPASNSVVVYGPQGALIQNRQTPLGSALGQFNQPAAVATGPGDTIFVLDDANGRIEEFSAKWQPLGSVACSAVGYIQYSPHTSAGKR